MSTLSTYEQQFKSGTWWIWRNTAFTARQARRGGLTPRVAMTENFRIAD
jgi:hypothetical protein